MSARAPAFAYSGTELDALTEARNYYQMLIRRFAPHLGRRVIEVGAGIGTFAAALLENVEVDQLTLIEPAHNNYPLLRDRFVRDSRVRTLPGYLEAHASTLSGDALVAVNVLEHVEDDVAFLRAARSVLAPERGRLLLFVPALPWLYGTLDSAFDHYRRYTRRMLRERLAAAGFAPLVLRYVNLPGVLGWFIAGRILRRTTLTPRAVRLYDRFVLPLTTMIESVWEPPLGQSLLAIAEPASSTASGDGPKGGTQ
ncbi:MAG: class I SAM-dependent methyltransferase [Gemmatimonadaceae bacterium]